MDGAKIRLGIFILSGVILLILGLLALGLSSMFTTKAKLMTVFDESVQGLSKGSAIKYKGVPIGTVSNIAILIESKTILVEMEVELKPFRRSNFVQIKSDPNRFYRYLGGEIERGLRCRLEYAGITGLKYIELDYFAQPGVQFAKIRGLRRSDDFYVPSSPSALRDVLRSVNTSLEKIAKIDFDRMSESVTASLERIQKLLGDPALSTAIGHIGQITKRLDESIERFNAAFTGERLTQISDDVVHVLGAVDKLTKQLNRDLEAMKLGETAGSIRGAVERIGGENGEISDTVNRLNSLIDSLTELVRGLEDDPRSVIFGKTKPEIKP